MSELITTIIVQAQLIADLKATIHQLQQQIEAAKAAAEPSKD